MNPQYKKGVLELCVLSLLRQRDRYGYEISEFLSQHIDIADGTVYPHIIDPATGYPAEKGLLSVSIITRRENGGSGTMADAYSTALYVMGETEAVDFWRQQADFDMVLVTEDGRVLYTPGLQDCFEKTEGSGYDYQLLTA